jgi:hypothetical protein
MTSSNLSKIKPKLRTQGRLSGNFGKSKVKAGSKLNEIGVTKAKVVKVTTQEEYLHRLYTAFDKAEDSKMKGFLYEEIRKILVQRGQWSK